MVETYITKPVGYKRNSFLKKNNILLPLLLKKRENHLILFMPACNNKKQESVIHQTLLNFRVFRDTKHLSTVYRDILVLGPLCRDGDCKSAQFWYSSIMHHSLLTMVVIVCVKHHQPVKPTDHIHHSIWFSVCVNFGGVSKAGHIMLQIRWVKSLPFITFCKSIFHEKLCDLLK